MAEERSDLIRNSNAEDDNPELVATMRDAQDNAYSGTDTATDTAVDFTDQETEEGATEETEKIRSQIESTREELSETIDAIQEKLSVENITQQVKENVNEQLSNAWQATKNTVYETTAEKVGMIMGYVNKGIEEVSDTKLAKTAQRSPLAVSLIGLGVGMLIYNSYYRGSSSSYRYASNRHALASRGDQSSSSSLSTSQNQVSGAASQAYDSVTDAAGKAYGTVGNVAGQAYDSAGNIVGQAYDTVGNLGSQVKDTASDLANKAHEQYDYYIEENPLAVGAVALAIGAAVGFSIPSTRYESQLVGETRDRLMGQTGNKISGLIKNAGEAAQEKFDSLKTVAERTADTAMNTAKKEAKNQDLM